MRATRIVGASDPREARDLCIGFEGGGPEIVFDGRRSGLCGFIGWERILQAMRNEGAVKSDERVLRMFVSERGIEFFVETAAAKEKRS
jgi:hypothetical protein